MAESHPVQVRPGLSQGPGLGWEAEMGKEESGRPEAGDWH